MMRVLGLRSHSSILATIERYFKEINSHSNLSSYPGCLQVVLIVVTDTLNFVLVAPFFGDEVKRVVVLIWPLVLMDLMRSSSIVIGTLSKVMW